MAWAYFGPTYLILTALCVAIFIRLRFLFVLYVLGARGIHPSQMAVMFFHAVEDFVSADKPKHLKRVGVVIYERKMVDEFTKAIAKETGADFQHAG